MLVACGLACLFGPAAEGADPGVRLVVGVLNYAGVPRETLDLAQAEASTICEEAGVSIEWWEPPRSASTDADRPAIKAASFFVKLLPDSMFPPEPQSSNAWGCAIGIQAFVFADRIQQASGTTSISFPKTLGHIMAHELGHVLLGKESHALGSIMSPTWGEWEFRNMQWGTLRFTPSQANRLVDRIRAQQAARR